MMPLAPETIVVSRRLWLEAGMGNPSYSDPRQVAAIVRREPRRRRSNAATVILDHFVDNNSQTPLASGRDEMLRHLV
jgi:hypothetical protein